MQHKKNELVYKILIGIVLLLTFLLGVQGASVGIFGFNIFTLIGSGVINNIKYYYLATGIATIISSVILFIKVYLRK